MLYTTLLPTLSSTAIELSSKMYVAGFILFHQALQIAIKHAVRSVPQAEAWLWSLSLQYSMATAVSLRTYTEELDLNRYLLVPGRVDARFVGSNFFSLLGMLAETGRAPDSKSQLLRVLCGAAEGKVREGGAYQYRRGVHAYPPVDSAAVVAPDNIGERPVTLTSDLNPPFSNGSDDTSYRSAMSPSSSASSGLPVEGDSASSPSSPGPNDTVNCGFLGSDTFDPIALIGCSISASDSDSASSSSGSDLPSVSSSSASPDATVDRGFVGSPSYDPLSMIESGSSESHSVPLLSSTAVSDPSPEPPLTSLPSSLGSTATVNLGFVGSSTYDPLAMIGSEVAESRPPIASQSPAGSQIGPAASTISSPTSHTPYHGSVPRPINRPNFPLSSVPRPILPLPSRPPAALRTPPSHRRVSPPPSPAPPAHVSPSVSPAKRRQTEEGSPDGKRVRRGGVEHPRPLPPGLPAPSAEPGGSLGERRRVRIRKGTKHVTEDKAL